MQFGFHKTPLGDVYGQEIDLRAIAAWTPTMAQLRETILKFHVCGPSHLRSLELDLPPGTRSVPTQEEVEIISEAAARAVRAGRLIDFGRLDNDIIKQGGRRGGPLYAKGLLAHPFAEPWLFHHVWEDQSAVYAVHPLEPDKPGGDCEIIEMQPVMLNGTDPVLFLGDRVTMMPDATLYGPKPEFESKAFYSARAYPSIWRFMPGASDIAEGMNPHTAAAANVLDPLVTVLLILSTRGITRETVRPSPKLARARVKARKPPIPPYDRVDCQLYVTAIRHARSSERREHQGGTHASPIMHLRRGHPRTYGSGIVRLIPDALVNATDDARSAAQRSHYTVKT